MTRIFCLALAIISTTSYAQIFLKSTAAPTETGGKSWAGSWGDFDNDGDFDLYVCNYYNNNFLYKNNGDGTFSKVSTAPLNTLISSSSKGHWSSTWVDYDNDKDLDLYVTNSYTDNGELFRNNGDGTFTSISSSIANTSTIDDNNAAWADTDGDGDLDLFLANGSNADASTRNQNNSYYINNGNGTFTQNTTSIISTDGGFSEFGTFGDYDDDGDPDLFVINTFQNSFFYENTGNGTFAKVLNLPFLSIGEQPLTACWADFNNDGYLDLVTGSYANSRVYFNNGDKTFRTGTLPGIGGNATGVSVGDFDLDGYQDIIFIRTGQSALYYQNNGDETFTNTNAGDLTSIALDYTNSGAVADYDNDGDLDIYINNDDSQNLLLKNTEVTNNWIAFKLNGISSNSQGVGAKVKIKINGHWQLREVGVLSSYRTQNSILAHFGIANATKIDLARIEWPSGKVQIIRDINANQILSVTEDNSPDTPHTLNLTVNGTEDEVVSLHSSDFKNAFVDEDGDKLKSIKVTVLPAHGQLFLNELPVEIGQTIVVKEIDNITFKPEKDFNGEITFSLLSIDRRNLEVTSSLTIHLEPVDDAPSISSIPDVLKNVLKIGDVVQVQFEVEDIDTDLDDLDFSVDVSDDAVIPSQNISFSGSGSLRSLNLITAKGGATEITITVSDGELEMIAVFSLTINTAQTFNLKLEVNEDEKLKLSSQSFKEAFVDRENDQLKEITVMQLSENGILFLGDDPVMERQRIQVNEIDRITFLPVKDFNGLITMKILTTDYRDLSMESDLLINVKPVNDPPIVEPIADVVKDAIDTGEELQVFVFINDVDNDVSLLTISVSSDDESVVKATDVIVSGEGNDRLLKIPVKNSGDTKLSLSISDGLSSTTTSFKLTVNNLITGIVKDKKDGLNAYPNPIVDKLNVMGINDEYLSYTITDYLGRIVLSGNALVGFNGEVSIDTRQISPGIFIFHCLVEDKPRAIKIIKENN